MSLRFAHLMAGAVISLLCMCAPMALAEADFDGGEFVLPEAGADVVEDELAIRELAGYQPHLIYTEDWSRGSGGWSNSQSYEIGRAPVRVFIGHPQAMWGLYFWGANGWALRGPTAPEVPLKVSIIGYVLQANRNALSVNVRTSGGTAIYKYGFCAGVIGANKQPPTWTYRDTDLGYRTETPYELYSIWVPNTARFAIGLKNLVTGEERMSRYFWACRSSAVPGCIDFDQEAGGKGPAVLGRVSVYALL